MLDSWFYREVLHQMIIIKMPRCILALTESDMMELLRGRPDIWTSSIKRGKYVSRENKEQKRKGK